jgi:hypothetical protein
LGSGALGEKAVLELMFGALIHAAERWRSVKLTEFERRQLTALREELDQVGYATKTVIEALFRTNEPETGRMQAWLGSPRTAA